MCNLYSQTKGQDAIRQLFDPVLAANETWKDSVGNLETQSKIWPDMQAPIIRRSSDNGWELVRARWGMPTPEKFLIGKKTDKGVTNIRNTNSFHWKRWLTPDHRCLVPFTSFSEIDMRANTAKNSPVWFALSAEEPLAFFAGLRVEWRSVRKLKEGMIKTELFGFLTCKPNTEVASVHPKAMPVVLTKPEEWRRWLTASIPDALQLQRPLRDGLLQIVADGTKSDAT
ncbi:MAG: SOS response-associated peptidase family protein [Aestuariivita sp.]|nr:SOS response-associated peptidase family protein [Aestuariivita sp.]MCY4201087.1 SOS response-associated peptidase family protein [Aestuariivita sp.]MCY4288273.1 SOS response-associated peptidase family protein [Aestuariivita sp.]MCY4345918.1 SOS response-associated peptidase family protein [Aestuariivita sp.]